MEAKFGNTHNKRNFFILFSYAKFVAKVAKFGITINVSILYDSKVNKRIRIKVVSRPSDLFTKLLLLRENINAFYRLSNRS